MSCHVTPLWGAAEFDVMSALTAAELYMKLADEGKRAFLRDRVTRAQGQDGIVAAKVRTFAPLLCLPQATLSCLAGMKGTDDRRH